MNRLGRARLWLGTAGIGAVMFATSLVAMLRSCERAAHADSIVEKDAHIWRTCHAPRPR